MPDTAPLTGEQLTRIRERAERTAAILARPETADLQHLMVAAQSAADVAPLLADHARLTAELSQARGWEKRAAELESKLARVTAALATADLAIRVRDTNLAMTRLALNGWESVGSTIAGYIPEHYDGDGALMSIVEEWAGHAAKVVDQAHAWRKLRTDQTAAALDAAVEVIYPTEEYL